MVATAAVGIASRTVLVVSADGTLRQRLRLSLGGMRWSVEEASGGAEAMARMHQQVAEAVLIDGWLPDLEAGEFAAQMHVSFPEVEILRVDGSSPGSIVRSARKHELLHALRESQRGFAVTADPRRSLVPQVSQASESNSRVLVELRSAPPQSSATPHHGIEELVGQSAPMAELARLVRLVAPRSATVLIEGETGTGKEIVARAVHRLGLRSHRPFVVLNCAAIPESLLEAELFGHTRGAFTGADRARTGRIETAHGGTLFLDEIGEMPLALQAKLLRFLENGEIQRVGDNEVVRVDVRVIAATHQHLEKAAENGAFRLDLYHRLAVFPLDIPPLRERKEDIQELAAHFLNILGRQSPRKAISPEAFDALLVHDWPGNVRELAHVVERAVILSGEGPTIEVAHVWVRRPLRGSSSNGRSGAYHA